MSINSSENWSINFTKFYMLNEDAIIRAIMKKYYDDIKMSVFLSKYKISIYICVCMYEAFIVNKILNMYNYMNELLLFTNL